VEPTEIVRSGYDRASEAYRRDDDPEAEAAYAGFLKDIVRLVPGGSRVLDPRSPVGQPGGLGYTRPPSRCDAAIPVGA
jgi:hypothetical protein